jgi:hypothetical protein
MQKIVKKAVRYLHLKDEGAVKLVGTNIDDVYGHYRFTTSGRMLLSKSAWETFKNLNGFQAGDEVMCMFYCIWQPYLVEITIDRI